MKNAESNLRGIDDRGRDIAARTYAFALRVMRVVKAMPKDVVAITVARQLVRSGTSVLQRSRLQELTTEADELVRIRTTIVRNARQKG